MTAEKVLDVVLENVDNDGSEIYSISMSTNMRKKFIRQGLNHIINDNMALTHLYQMMDRETAVAFQQGLASIGVVHAIKLGLEDMIKNKEDKNGEISSKS